MSIQFVNTGESTIAQSFEAFRFDPQVYMSFKDLASRNGFTVTAALEKFMADAVKFGLAFPSAKNAATELRRGLCSHG